MALVFGLIEDCPPRIDRMLPQRLDSAFFGIGMGHFFDSEPRFGITKGVWRTVVGYSGGRYETPSYGNMGDHVEVVMVEYDPMTLSYGQLLDIFFNCCDCRRDLESISRVFVKNEFEKRMAKAAVARYELCSGKENGVKVVMHKSFHKAEKWCQKHFLRMFPQLMDELSHIYHDEDCLLQSTLATRLNGILGQRLFQEFSAFYIPDDFEFYDLSECAAGILRKIME